jgi:hypothetical protein
MYVFAVCHIGPSGGGGGITLLNNALANYFKSPN